MSDWLLSTFLATSALVLLVLILREPVRRYFGARAAYGLWLIPAARMFMPTLTHTVERRVPVSISPMTDPIHASALSMVSVSVVQPSAFERLGGWPMIALVVWGAVAAALFLSRIIAFHHDRRAILATSRPFEQAGFVRIVRSSEVTSPVALGIIDPIIAVPANFERLYGLRERRLVIEHELAHHRSGDLVANLFAFVLLCLQWFNPLAWVAHAAFRFDQEAACDARVLDKASAADRADYGRAIAKAASGRALLFASALDRRNSLHRRLQSMLKSSNPARRVAGRIMIVGALAVALPLTATRAIEYVDIPVRAATPPRAASPVATAVAAAAVAQPAPAVTAVTPARPVATPITPGAAMPNQFHDDLTISGDFITIDGQRKRWEDLTPAEKTRVREAVARARASLQNVHIDRDKIMREVANIPNKVDMAKIRSDVARGQASAAEALRNIEANRAAMERAGVQPDAIEATVAKALQSVQAVDLQSVQRSLATIDRGKIAHDVAGAEQSVQKARAELDRLQARMDADHN